MVVADGGAVRRWPGVGAATMASLVKVFNKLGYEIREDEHKFLSSKY